MDGKPLAQTTIIQSCTILFGFSKPLQIELWNIFLRSRDTTNFCNRAGSRHPQCYLATGSRKRSQTPRSSICKDHIMQELVANFIKTANAFDIEGVMSLVAPDAIIDDVSVGDAFIGPEGIKQYLNQFFVGYHTQSRLLSVGKQDDHTAFVRLDFASDFGHEIGVLKITINSDGWIHADLE
ncbi:nuclear transport factor 2 family protein [Agrobacterium vitis]|nr:nuclear transport factor 2 family protein [Agrobacterium vitis]